MAYYIGPRCSACHYCYNECPVHAIRFSGTSYEIDEFKCIGCGKCAQVCPSGIIYDPMNVSEPEPHAPQELECDLVVLGGGGSGLVAAVRARGIRLPCTSGKSRKTRAATPRWATAS